MAHFKNLSGIFERSMTACPYAKFKKPQDSFCWLLFHTAPLERFLGKLSMVGDFSSQQQYSERQPLYHFTVCIMHWSAYGCVLSRVEIGPVELDLRRSKPTLSTRISFTLAYVPLTEKNKSHFEQWKPPALKASFTLILDTAQISKRHKAAATGVVSERTINCSHHQASLHLMRVGRFCCRRAQVHMATSTQLSCDSGTSPTVMIDLLTLQDTGEMQVLWAPPLGSQYFLQNRRGYASLNFARCHDVCPPMVPVGPLLDRHNCTQTLTSSSSGRCRTYWRHAFISAQTASDRYITGTMVARWSLGASQLAAHVTSTLSRSYRYDTRPSRFRTLCIHCSPPALRPIGRGKLEDADWPLTRSRADFGTARVRHCAARSATAVRIASDALWHILPTQYSILFASFLDIGIH
ncbi:hypothetical protein T06_1844 [Trichinella sp. T6]|nr:hypothetical protein T06_1844 [Trichinella sp. T6]